MALVRVITLTLLAVIAVALIAGCPQIEYPPPPPQETELRFRTISIGHNSGYTERRNYVITNDGDWRDLWNKTYAIVLPPPAAPEIDLAQNMIIAVYMGERRTGGYRIEIVKVLEHKDYIEVFIEETYPEPGAIVTTALTQPYHIIEVQRVDKDIVFRPM